MSKEEWEQSAQDDADDIKHREAMAHIKAVFKKYDLCGTCLIFSGNVKSEYLFATKATWSIMKQQGYNLQIKTNPSASREVKKKQVTSVTTFADHLREHGLRVQSFGETITQGISADFEIKNIGPGITKPTRDN